MRCYVCDGPNAGRLEDGVPRCAGCAPSVEAARTVGRPIVRRDVCGFHSDGRHRWEFHEGRVRCLHCHQDGTPPARAELKAAASSETIGDATERQFWGWLRQFYADGQAYPVEGEGAILTPPPSQPDPAVTSAVTEEWPDLDPDDALWKHVLIQTV